MRSETNTLVLGEFVSFSFSIANTMLDFFVFLFVKLSRNFVEFLTYGSWVSLKL